jgi:hypothetical protein
MTRSQRMTRNQETALKFHCRLAFETAHPRFCSVPDPFYSLVLSVNSGYE